MDIIYKLIVKKRINSLRKKKIKLLLKKKKITEKIEMIETLFKLAGVKEDDTKNKRKDMFDI